MAELKLVPFEDKTFRFAVARTAYELTRGLSGIASLEPLGWDGMLFDFGQNFAPIMIPRGLMFPIDVAFIDWKGTVLEIATMFPSYGHDVSMQGETCRYVLETPLGFLSANNVVVGSILAL